MWFVPVLVISIAGLIFAFLYSIMMWMKSNGAYELAVVEATQHHRVVEALGEPVETGWYVVGNIRYVNADGAAELQIPLQGPSGEGTLYVVAEREAGVWEFEHLLFLHDGKRMNLLTND